MPKLLEKPKMENLSETDKVFFQNRDENYQLKTQIMIEFMSLIRKYPSLNKCSLSGAFAQSINHLFPKEVGYKKSKEKSILETD